MIPFSNLRKLAPPPQSAVGWCALLIIALPPLLLGPWLPLLDLVAFTGLDAYPAKLSYGPLHFGAFQFTYIVHYALARFLSALGVAAGAQIVLTYLLQALVLFTVVWRLLQRLVPDPWICSVAVSLGTLAFWDGLFLWGGPLPFSLAATALAAATFLTLLETEETPAHASTLVPALTLLSIMCHPFALPFALLLGALRFCFVPSRRFQSAGTLVALLVLAWVIRQDSADTEVNLVAGLSSFHANQVLDRFSLLFTVDRGILQRLFGFSPAGLSGYFSILGAIHLIGFVTSPWVAVVAKESPRLRLLAVLNTCVAVMYFATPGLDDILLWWPQRILTFYSPFTFAAGIACPWFLLHTRAKVAARPLNPSAGARWFLPPVILLSLAFVQIPVLRLSGVVLRNYEKVRDEILRTGISNAYLVTSNLEEIQPFYLRCVPFLLYSDRQILGRNLQILTEWHSQSRHPTRLVEKWLDLGRPRYLASFAMNGGGLSVRLVPAETGRAPAAVKNNLLDVSALEFNLGNELLNAGAFRDAAQHFRAALAINATLVQAHNNLGFVLTHLGEEKEALASFQAAFALSPRYVEARCNAGAILLRLGRLAEAADCFQTALGIQPDLAAAQAGLRQVAEQKARQ